MNERKEWACNNHILSPFGARFAPSPCERQVGKTRAHPSALVVTIARRKLLIKKRLQVLQFDARLPSFRQAMDWSKWETLWVNGSVSLNGTGIALEASK
jgi:hypothetical protein